MSFKTEHILHISYMYVTVTNYTSQTKAITLISQHQNSSSSQYICLISSAFTRKEICMSHKQVWTVARNDKNGLKCGQDIVNSIPEINAFHNSPNVW